MKWQEEGGWPLGLQPLGGRVSGGLASGNRTRDNSGCVSFSTLLTGSPSSSTDSSPDLDSEVCSRPAYLLATTHYSLPVGNCWILLKKHLRYCVLLFASRFFVHVMSFVSTVGLPVTQY